MTREHRKNCAVKLSFHGLSLAKNDESGRICRMGPGESKDDWN